MRRISSFLFAVYLFFLLSTANVEAGYRISTKALSHYIRAGIYERLNQLRKAVKEYRVALKADYLSPQIHLRLAVALLKQKQFLPATDELKLAIRYYEDTTNSSDPKASFIEAHTLLALVYSLQGKLEEAAAEYETALRGVLVIDPKNIRIHKSLAQVYLKQNKFQDAEKTYQFILNIAPSDFEAHFFLGTVYEEQGRRYEAIREFETALEFNPEYADALNSLGYLYAEESINLEKAEELLKKALTYEPNNGAYVDSLGWVYFKQGRYEEAIQELEQAVQFLSDSVIYEHLGDVYLRQGDFVKARENWQKSLEIDPEENLQIKEKLEKYK